MSTQNHLATLLRNLHDSIRLAKYNMAKQYGLNTSEFEVLVSLYQSSEPLSIKQLSNELLLCSQAITKICKNLQSLGLVDSSKSSIDRRITRVELTAAGNRIASVEDDYRRKLISNGLSGSKSPELQQLENHLEQVNAVALSLAQEY
jgi:DNA-binding MarR family transcriptional regulator